MKETVVVTLVLGKEEMDFELPCNNPLSELYPRLLCVLKKVPQNDKQDTQEIMLQGDYGVLDDYNASLSDYGVQTGSRLKVLFRE